MMKKIKLIFLVLICSSLINCAKRGIPDGGPKDENPPVLLNSEPAENSFNFNEEIELVFISQSINNTSYKKKSICISSFPKIILKFLNLSPFILDVIFRFELKRKEKNYE